MHWTVHIPIGSRWSLKWRRRKILNNIILYYFMSCAIFYIHCRRSSIVVHRCRYMRLKNRVLGCRYNILKNIIENWENSICAIWDRVSFCVLCDSIKIHYYTFILSILSSIYTLHTTHDSEFFKILERTLSSVEHRVEKSSKLKNPSRNSVDEEGKYQINFLLLDSSENSISINK